VTLELTDEERATIRNVRDGWEGGAAPQEFVYLVAIIHKLQAGKMKAEFTINHVFMPRNMTMVCARCMNGPKDPCHNYTDEQWLEAARAEFSKEGKG